MDEVNAAMQSPVHRYSTEYDLLSTGGGAWGNVIIKQDGYG